MLNIPRYSFFLLTFAVYSKDKKYKLINENQQVMKRKKFNLNQNYIAWTAELCSKYGGTLKNRMKDASHRLNEQARVCEYAIAAWSLEGKTTAEITDILEKWNAHTLAMHTEVVEYIRTETLKRADTERLTLEYTHYPNARERNSGINIVYSVAVPFLKCVDKRNGVVRKRVKVGEKWFTFKTF